MVTISTRRGVYISATNQNFPKLERIAALRLLMAERAGRAAGGFSSLSPAAQALAFTRLPILGRVPSHEVA